MFRKFGIDFKATLPQTVVGLVGGVVVFKYIIRPTIQPMRDGTQPSTTVIIPQIEEKKKFTKLPVAITESGNIEANQLSPLVQELDGNDALESLGTSKSVILITRDFPEDYSKDALLEFSKSAKSLREKYPKENLKFFVVSDQSSQTHAMALLGRLGLSYSYPFVVIMDNFKATENKYLDTKVGALTKSSIESFVSKYVKREIKPALLGQERPENDKNPYCDTITEVVTDSFNEIVLNPKKDVLIQTYTTRCDACKAFSARYRTLSKMTQKYWGEKAPVIAIMNVLDNDKDFRFLPEKYTPAIRFFPVSPSNKGEKEGFVLDMLSIADSGSLSPMQYSQDPNGTTVYLPTLVDMLEFMAARSTQGLSISEQMRKVAEEQEVTCAYIETSYETCLNFMQLWKAFMDLIEDWRYDLSKVNDSDGSIRKELERRELEAEALKQKIVAAYNFIVNESCADNFSMVLDQLDDISLMVTHHGIRDAIDRATKDANHRLSSSKSGQLQ